MPIDENITYKTLISAVYPKYRHDDAYRLGVYNRHVAYPDREKICMMCPFRSDSVCTKAGMELKDFINLRLAYCPVYKWG